MNIFGQNISPFPKQLWCSYFLMFMARM